MPELIEPTSLTIHMAMGVQHRLLESAERVSKMLKAIESAVGHGDTWVDVSGWINTPLVVRISLRLRAELIASLEIREEPMIQWHAQQPESLEAVSAGRS